MTLLWPAVAVAVVTFAHYAHIATNAEWRAINARRPTYAQSGRWALSIARAKLLGALAVTYGASLAILWLVWIERLWPAIHVAAAVRGTGLEQP